MSRYANMTFVLGIIIGICMGIIMIAPEHDKVPPVQEAKKEAQETKKEAPVAEHDRKFSIRYTVSEDSWNQRYGASETPFAGWMTSWKGGKRLTERQLEDLARRVFKHLPHIRTTRALLDLVVETAVAESDGGRIVKNSFGDYGVFQMKPWVAKESLAWLKANHKDVYRAIMNLRDRRLSEKDNLVRNLPYATAMCVTYYWRRAGDSALRRRIETQHERAVMWKSLYNTRKGYGTVAAYIERNKNYVASN